MSWRSAKELCGETLSQTKERMEGGRKGKGERRAITKPKTPTSGFQTTTHSNARSRPQTQACLHSHRRSKSPRILASLLTATHNKPPTPCNFNFLIAPEWEGNSRNSNGTQWNTLLSTPFSALAYSHSHCCFQTGLAELSDIRNRC